MHCDILSVVFASCIAILVLWVSFGCGRRKKRFPKGPTGFPVLGYIPWLAPKVHVEISKLGKKYGNIFSVKMGQDYWVVLNDYDSIKSALRMDVFSGRPRHKIVLEAFKNGIAFNEGKDWAEQRKFSMKTLKDFGWGTQSMEAVIHDNVSELVDHYRKTAGTPQYLPEHVSMAGINLVWQIITGKKVPLNDPYCRSVFKIGREGVLEKATNGAIYVVPWLAKMFPSLTGLDSLLKARDELRGMLRKVYEGHLVDFVPGQNPRDLADVYLQKIKNSENDLDSSFHGEKGMENFVDLLANFFMASGDTVTSTVQFAILFLLKWPEKMKKLRKEIDAVLGKKMAKAEDKLRMPYTDAVMQETLRLSSILPGANLHKTLDDVEFKGFLIPKGTIIYPNLYQVHRDPEYWEMPNEFYPERFLTFEKGSSTLTCKKDERVIAFGIGKRECVAMGMAEKEFFIFLTSLIQHFEIEAVGDLPGIEARSAFVLEPEKFNVILTPR